MNATRVSILQLSGHGRRLLEYVQLPRQLIAF